MDGENGKKVIVYNTNEGKKKGDTEKRLKRKRERKRENIKN